MSSPRVSRPTVGRRTQRSMLVLIVAAILSLVAPKAAEADVTREHFAGLSATTWVVNFDGCIYEEHFIWVQRGSGPGDGWTVQDYETTYDLCNGGEPTQSYGQVSPVPVAYSPTFESLSFTTSIPMDDGTINEVSLRLTGVGEIEQPRPDTTMSVFPSQQVMVQVIKARLRSALVDASVNGQTPYDVFGYFWQGSQVFILQEPTVPAP